jgi:uncharacterized membrane protein YphA (DoxX/SURF4 family)
MSTLTTNNAPRALSLPDVSQAHWLLRLSVAATFIYHGVTKLPALEAGAAFMGMPVWLWTLVAVVEIVAGLALVAGGALRSTIGDLLTRVGGVSVIAIMLGAIALVHWGQWSALAQRIASGRRHGVPDPPARHRNLLHAARKQRLSRDMAPMHGPAASIRGGPFL